MAPDATGRYDRRDIFQQRYYYQRGTDPWFVWSGGPGGPWYISASPGVTNAANPSWQGPADPLGPDGEYQPNLIATGVATVAFPKPP